MLLPGRLRCPRARCWLSWSWLTGEEHREAHGGRRRGEAKQRGERRTLAEAEHAIKRALLCEHTTRRSKRGLETHIRLAVCRPLRVLGGVPPSECSTAVAVGMIFSTFCLLFFPGAGFFSVTVQI